MRFSQLIEETMIPIDEDRGMDRREALRRVAILLGGALSAPTLAGAFSADMEAWAATPEAQWVPRTLTPAQAELVATVAEHIIPTTDTPGARAAGVHRYVDALLTRHYAEAERDRFVAGVQGVDVRARAKHGKNFVRLTKREQVALLQDMDHDAYAAPATVANAPEQQAPRDSVAQSGAAGMEGVSEAVRAELKSPWFWRRMKELTLVGYYTSKVGATQELHVNPMGMYKSVPLRTIGRTWA